MNAKVIIFLRKSFILSVLIVFSGMAGAQGIDFSGKWKLAPSKSKLNEQFSMAPKELVIVQGDNSLSVERTSEFQGQEYKSTSKYTLDGVECVNTGMMDMKLKSTVSWSDDKTSLVIKTKTQMENGGEISITDTYKMNGADLSVETNASGDWGTSSETYVFEKQAQ
jgi:hypothetical protein